MKTWRSTRLLSIVLALSMIFQMLPMQALGEETKETVSDEPTSQSVISVLGEVESLREEDTKHFRLSDGSYIAVSYGTPVHTADEEGRWQDIDNSLTPGDSSYQLNRTDTAVSFQNVLTNGTVLVTSKGDASITMSLLDREQAEQLLTGERLEGPQPEETVEETLPENIEETILEETISEETGEENVEETVEETTVEIMEEIPEETEPAETVDQAELLSDLSQDDSVSREAEAVNEVPNEETESTQPEFAQEETEAALPEETIPETTEETAPEETVPETTEEALPEETVSETTEEALPEETVPEATEEILPEETVPETSEETVPEGTQGLCYNRNASAHIVEDVPSMLALEEEYSWEVRDVIPGKLQSSLIYEDVFPNIDLLYTAFGNNIKEQIVVRAPQNSYRYDFLLALNGLTAVKEEDGSVTLSDSEGSPVYKIPTPYMEDGNGVISPEVSFTLTETDQGLVLSVEASAEWMNAEERAFPVKIDPSFVIVSGKALDEIYSVYTMEAAPNDTTLGRQYLYVGAQPYNTTNDGRYRLYMHFNDMPSIPAGSEVVNAQLSLYQFQYTQRQCPSFPIGVYEVTTDLPSAYSSYYDWFTKMTWRRDQPSYDNSNAIDYVMVDATKGYRTWNLTELVKKWYAEKTSNTTAALVMMNEEEIDTYYYYASATFYAYAGSIPPILIVSYRNNTGIEPYYTYGTLGGASAGTAYIADATGQLKVGKELVSYASSVNPFSLNLIYNSDYFCLNVGILGSIENVLITQRKNSCFKRI